MALYTHKIIWSENSPEYGVLTKSFRTTEDAIKGHLTRLLESDIAFYIQCENLPLTETICQYSDIVYYSK